MKKKIILFLSVFCIGMCLMGCTERHEHDTVDIWNKTDSLLDNVRIDAKDGYFYNSHEKFKVDDDTIAVTIYFTREDLNGSGGWDEPQN